MKDLFLTLFRIAAHKTASMADLWGRQGGEGRCWKVHFRRSFQDWELKEVTHFLEYISAVKVQELEDSLVWKNDGKGKFNVKSYYRSLRAENSFLFPAKEIWGSYTPLRTRFFCLGSSLGKIFNNGLCKDSEELADRVLIHCGKMRELGTLLLTSFELVWVFTTSMRNLFLEWKVTGLGKKRKAVWRLAPICLF